MNDIEAAINAASLCGSRSVEGVAVCGNGKWQAGEQGDDSGEAPTAEDGVANAGVEVGVSMAGGQFVIEALLEVSGAVEVTRSIVSAQVDEEHQTSVVVSSGGVVQFLAPCKCRGEGEAGRKRLVSCAWSEL